MIDDNYAELLANFKKGKDLIRQAENESIVDLNGLMTMLGFGLD